jgi:OmpA family
VGGATALGNAGVAAGYEAAAIGKSGFQRFLPWIIGAIILALLWWLLSPKAPAPVPTPVPVAAAPAMAPAAMAALPAKVYFDVGSAAIGADGSKAISAAADAIKKDNLKAAITGYTDKTGDTAKNEELAKNRALAVRDALQGAGVPAGSIEMRPPLFVEAGTFTNDAEARRVEISKL